MTRIEAIMPLTNPLAATGCRKYFLVIEDDADDAAFIRRAFSPMRDCSAFVCRNSSEAKAYLQGAGLYKDRQKYPVADAIIGDLRLGEESGVEFVAWLKAGELKHLPVAILTGFDAPMEMAAAQKLGAVMSLRKPKTTEELGLLLLGFSSKVSA